MRKLLILTTLLLSGVVAQADAPAAFDVPALSKLLTREQASTVKFHEQQFRKVLSAPLERSGELVFQPPDVFIRRVQQPGSEEYKLEGDTLTIQMGTRKARHLSTRDQPLLRGLMLSFQAVVSGKLDMLEPYYLLQLTGDPAQWQLVLDPKDAALKQHVKRVVIDGRESNPVRFEVTEQSGDRTVTEIEP
jgi:outer membrane lipoprotein-sorting protein